MLDGIMNVFTFVWKSINDKFIEVLETKEIVDTFDIADFKAFITIVENFQDFLSKKLIIPQ